MAEALKLSPLNEQQLSQVNLLLQSGKGLMSILNDTLDVSKIEAGKMDIEALPVNLEGLCMMTAEVWKSTASAKGLVLACEIDPATPDWVLGDATRLRQIMTNLISNALKFTERGGVTLSLRPLSQADGCVSLELAVSDTGVGLSEIHAARLFQPFAQAETSTARRYGGTGLGLNICKRLAEMMGGDIVLESRLGEGSTFRVTVALPITSDPGFEEEAAPLFDIGGLRILVVDDNATNRAVAVAILGAFGAQVQTANDGLEGLTALRESDFDLVLMDIHMPNLGGEGALVQIRAGETGRAQIPVIAFTADAQASEVERLVDLGFNGVQPKPINPTTLIEAISKISHIALGQTAPSDEIHRPLARLA
jgi:CheY-like chemotaxis protein